MTDPTQVFENLELYEQWDRDYYHPAAIRLYDRAVARMLEDLKFEPGSLVLDAGCGPGVHSIRAARLGARVLGIDISQTVLDEARRRIDGSGVGDRIELRRQDLTHLELTSESYSAVFCWGVVIHVPEIARALAELARVLAPGGRLALQVTNRQAWDHKIERLARRLLRREPQAWERGPLGEGRWFEMEGGGELWVWRVDADDLIRVLEKAGLQFIGRRPVEFTELQWRVKAAFRRPLIWLNSLWQRAGGSPKGCATSILVFEKSRTK